MFFGDEHVHEHVHEYGETDGNLDFTVIHGSEKHAKHIPRFRGNDNRDLGI